MTSAYTESDQRWGDPPATLLRRASCLLWDFDGPLCRLFAGRPAPGIAAAFRELLAEEGLDAALLGLAETTDPQAILRARLPAEVTRRLEESMAEEEEEAAATAEPTPGAGEFARLMAERGRTLAITTNNAPRAVAAYLKAYDLDGVFGHRIFGRSPDDPRLMKPHPDCLLRAMESLSAVPGDCLMIGDSPADAHAAAAAGVPFLGYARNAGRVARLVSVPGVRAVVVGMGPLTSAARDLPGLGA